MWLRFGINIINFSVLSSHAMATGFPSHSLFLTLLQALFAWYAVLHLLGCAVFVESHETMQFYTDQLFTTCSS